MSKTVRNPMQPFVLKGDVIRFKENAIVRTLLDWARDRGMGLNELARMEFTQDDRCQFAQLIGYSLCGYHELSYVSDEHAAEATAAAQTVLPGAKGCRDDGCDIHLGVKRDD